MSTNPVRYFSPAQSSWNLAHIIRLMPESHALFAAPEGCTRIIMISAAAKGMTGRFSAVAVTNADVVGGGVEQKIMRAAEEVMWRRGPKALFIVTSCIADFIGADHTEVYMTRQQVLDTLEEVISLLGTYDITTIRASMGMYLCCKAIHEQTDIRVLLTGEISDELFGYKYTDFAPSPEAFQQEAKKRVD